MNNVGSIWPITTSSGSLCILAAQSSSFLVFLLPFLQARCPVSWPYSKMLLSGHSFLSPQSHLTEWGQRDLSGVSPSGGQSPAPSLTDTLALPTPARLHTAFLSGPLWKLSAPPAIPLGYLLLNINSFLGIPPWL